MRTKTLTAQVAVTSAIGKQTYSIEYSDLEFLSQRIFDLTFEEGYVLDETTITLSDGKSYRWNEYYVHNSFAKNRISEEDFVKLQFSEENAL